AAQIVFEQHKASGVTARPGQGDDNACADWIRDRNEHNWQGAGDTLQCRHAQRTDSKDHVRRVLDQFCRISAVKIDIVPAPPDFDAYIAAVAPTELPQGLLKRRNASLTQ